MLSHRVFLPTVRWSLVLCCVGLLTACDDNDDNDAELAQPELGSNRVALIDQDGYSFKDLNDNATVDAYEDWRLSPKKRAEDLVQRMTREEKIGLMMHGTAPAANHSAFGVGQTYDLDKAREIVLEQHVNSMITRLSGENPAQLAEQNNALQRIAEQSRLGIPITISTDPRNSYDATLGASNAAGGFSQWPEPIGMGAIGEAKWTFDFANTVRTEYRAVGLTEALSPQADIATEPRWPRINGTFGEDPQRVRTMVNAYIRGVQNGADGLNEDSVAGVVKHWVGYGAAAEQGWDSHNYYGRYANFATGHLDEHIFPFLGAFDANVAAVMPTYSILQDAKWKGEDIEPVGAGYNKTLLTDILRGRYGFNGVILSDWRITNDCNDACINGAAEGVNPPLGGVPWGVRSLSRSERFLKAINAGVDQFGGVTDSSPVLAIKDGRLPESRIDASAQRILTQKFQLGLFEQPYVDTEAVADKVGSESAVKQADRAQFRSLVLLQNDDLLPLPSGTRVWASGVTDAAIEAAGFQVAADPANADVALVRTATPYEQLHPGYVVGSRQHEGSLAFQSDDEDYQLITRLSKQLPVIVTVYMDRPAILTNIVPETNALIANFGVSDENLMLRLASDEDYTATLPFALPRSMDQVEAQQPNVPNDLGNPLFALGFGLEN